MKRSLLALSMAVLASLSAHATYVTVPVTGFNADVVANGSGPASASTTNDVDGANYGFMAASYNPAGTPPTQYLPTGGLVNSAATTGLSFQLASYSSNNSLRISGTGTGSLTVTTPVSAGEVYVLGTSGSGNTTVDITVYFTDGTNQAFTGITTFSDWYNGTPYAITGLGRVNIPTDGIDNNTSNPRLYQAKLTLSSGNYTKQIASIGFSKTSTSGVLNIMAVSINDVCTGTPTAGAASASPASVCSTETLNLSLTGNSSSSGITYQWQDSNATTSNAWVNITGATNATYSYVGQTVATKYRCALVCTPSSSATVYSTPVTVGQLSACPCVPTFTNGCSSWRLTNVTIGTINNSPTAGNCSVSNYLSMSTTLTAGVPAAMSITGQQYLGFAVYGDFNMDGDFNDPDELLYSAPYSGNMLVTVTPNITVPGYVLPGVYRMRVLATWGTSGAAGGACLNYQYGNFHDYSINVLNNSSCFPPANLSVSNILATAATFSWSSPPSTTPLGYRWVIVTQGQPATATPVASGGTNNTTLTVTPTGLASSTAYTFYIRSGCGPTAADSSVWVPINFTTICGGTPNGGTAQSSVTSTCPNTTFNLSATGSTSGPGITYQWESSPNGTTWTPISGATTTTYAITNQTAATYYHLLVTCGSGTPSASTSVQVTQNPATQCYCIPTYSNGGSGDIVTNVVLGSWSNNSAALGNPASHYTDYTTQQPGTIAIPAVSQGQNATLAITFGTDGSQYNGVWIDFNKDGTFATTEFFTSNTNAGGSGTANVTLAIPAAAPTGITRMRIRGGDDSQPSNTQACGASNSSWGEAEDYLIRIRPAAPTVSASPNPLCAGAMLTLTASSPLTGTTFIWSGPNSYTATGGSVTITNITTAQAGAYTAKVIVGTDTSDAASVTVTVNPTPAGVTAGSNTPLCSGNTLNLTSSSTSTGVTYAWTGPNSFTAATQNPSITSVTTAAAGTYTVTASIGTCTATASTTVVVNPGPSLTAGSNSPVCSGNTLGLTASSTASGVSYAWTGPNSFSSTLQNPTITNATTAASGTYSVTATALGCSTTNTVAVTVNQTPAGLTAGSNSPVCSGTALNLTSSSTTAGVSYTWSGPNSFTASTQNPSVASATTAATGTYTVTATANGCSATATTNVTVNPTPSIASATGTNPTACFGNDGKITITGLTPSTAYTLSYSKNGNPQTPVSITSTATGTYVINGLGIGTYTNIKVAIPATGCTSAAAATVTLVNPITVPTPTAGNNGPLCVGSTLNLSASTTLTGSTYSWTGPGGFNSTTQNPSIPSVALANAGVYTVTAYYQGCISNPATTTVVVHTNPVATATANGTTTICQGDFVTLQANAGTGLSYQWKRNGGNVGTGISYNASVAGNYTVTVTNTNGCSTTSAPPVTVTVVPTPASTISHTTPLAFCEGKSVTLTAPTGTGYTYIWYLDGNAIPGATSDSYIATLAGAYTVRVTGASGCTSLSASATVTVFHILTPIITRGGNLLSTSGYTSYQWYLNGSPIPGATSPDYTITQNGYYTVTAGDANGCSATSAIAWIQDLSVNNTIRPESVKIYPNPASSVVHIEAPVKVNVQLRNMHGQLVLEKANASEIDISTVANGVYMILITDKENRTVKMEKLSVFN
jgi:hypothetical protein